MRELISLFGVGLLFVLGCAALAGSLPMTHSPRSREEIETDIAQVPDPALSLTERLALEVWLDIRDLLQEIRDALQNPPREEPIIPGTPASSTNSKPQE
jgi:hypothetical protein